MQDVRYAFRMLRKSPALSAVMVVSLAIGIGANTAIFSVVNGLLLKPLPYPEPGRIAILWLRSPGIGIPQDWPSPGQYIDLQTQNHVFEEMSIARGGTFVLSGRQQPERIEGLRASSSLFHILGAKPHLGRLLLPDEDKPGKPPVVILSYGVWRRLFGGDRAIVGQSITLDGNPYSVAGVLGPEFLLNPEVMPTVAGTERMDVFLPLPLGADAVRRRGDENYNLLARLKPGVTWRQAQADVDVIAARIRTLDKRDRTFTISVVPLLDQVVGDVRRAVLVLLGSVGLVLLIACANVANLLLSRATGRRKEVAIRTALGAGWRRLVRQLLTEALLLAVLGGTAGLVVAWWSLYALRTINPGNIPRLADITLDARVLAFTFAVSILTGVLFGLAPAWRASRVDLNTALKAGGRASRGAGGFQLARQRLRSLLAVAELALSLMLLIGAGLLLRSFLRLGAVPPGFNPDGVISLHLALSGPRYRQPPPAQPVYQFYRDLTARIRRLPAVKSAGAVTTLPFTSSIGWGGIRIEGYTPPPDQPELQVDLRIAAGDYFQTMQIPLIEGRFFDSRDAPGAPRAVIIDDKMKQRFWPHESALGKHVRQGLKEPWWTIVGVVGTVKQYGLDVDGRMVVYAAHQQLPAGSLYLVARSATGPAALANSIVREIHSLDPDVPAYDIHTMTGRVHDSLARRRFAAAMLGAFALFALILAAIGVYGVISYLVTQGTHDIGIRIALGAPRGNILRMIVRQGMGLAAVGILAGLAGAAALTRVMATLLFGVSATDALTFSAVALFLGLIALLACYLPARRATRVDPTVALHEE